MTFWQMQFLRWVRENVYFSMFIQLIKIETEKSSGNLSQNFFLQKKLGRKG